MSAPPGNAPPPGSEPKTAELLRQLSDQVSTLVSQEIELAKAELSEKGKKAGLGAGMFGGAAVVAFYGGIALVAFLVLILAEIGLATWLSALVVAVALFAVAGVLALSGKKQVDQVGAPAPEQAIASVKQDTETIKTRAQAGRNG